MIFMPPGGIVAEIVGEFDGRMTPLCGFHGPLAAVFGHHHYIHYYDSFGKEEINYVSFVEQLYSLYKFLIAQIQNVHFSKLKL